MGSSSLRLRAAQLCGLRSAAQRARTAADLHSGSVGVLMEERFWVYVLSSTDCPLRRHARFKARRLTMRRGPLESHPCLRFERAAPALSSDSQPRYVWSTTWPWGCRLHRSVHEGGMSRLLSRRFDSHGLRSAHRRGSLALKHYRADRGMCTAADSLGARSLCGQREAPIMCTSTRRSVQTTVQPAEHRQK